MKASADSIPARATAERPGTSARAAERQNAAAYLAWESANHRDGLDELDRATAALSLDSAEW